MEVISTYDEIILKLAKLVQKLNDTLIDIYQPKVILNQSKSTSDSLDKGAAVIHNHYHSDPSYPVIYPVIYPQTTVIHHVQTSDNEEKSGKQQYPITGLTMFAGTAISGTYALANDRYLKFYRSGIDNDIIILQRIVASLYDRKDSLLIKNISNKYDEWLDAYLSRYKPVTNSKIAGIASATTIAGGLFLGSISVMTGGVFGLIGASCYYIWHHYTTNENTYNNLFDDFFGSVRKAQYEFEEKRNKLTN